MAAAAALRLALLVVAAGALVSGASAACRHTNLTADFSADFTMLQHQLRGTVRLAPDGSCALHVSRFDLLAASPSARFWAAQGASLSDLAAGRPFSPLPLNSTFRNETLNLPFSRPLPPLLALFDPDTSSDLGHVFFPVSNATDSGLARPSPAPVPTVFDNCLPLAENKYGNTVSVGRSTSLPAPSRSASKLQWDPSTTWRSGGRTPRPILLP